MAKWNEQTTPYPKDEGEEKPTGSAEREKRREGTSTKKSRYAMAQSKGEKN